MTGVNIPEMKRPAYTMPKVPPLPIKRAIPNIQITHSSRTAQRRPMRSQTMKALSYAYPYQLFLGIAMV